MSVVQPQTPDAKKNVSEGEEYSDTANEITTFEVIYYFYLKKFLFFCECVNFLIES